MRGSCGEVNATYIRNGAWADALPETFSSKLYADAAIGFLEAEASSDDPFLLL